MCGICGTWNTQDLDGLTEMMQTIKHRGPDDRGTHIDTHCSLGHVRLSIMDPAKGHQPLYNENKNVAIMANGEIYNYPSLLKELQHKHNFCTGNDSEAILHLYEDCSTNVVDKLDGMFAFCIVDGQDIFLARDYIGIKPLYIAFSDNNRLYYSSELKNLLDIPGEIQEFPPGTTYHSEHGFRTFYTVPEPREVMDSEETYTSALRKGLGDAVKKRLMSDVPLGCFLSGGLDSSLIAALARQDISPLHTFSVGMEGSNDLEAARVVAQHIESTHHEYIITLDEVIAKLPEIIYALESFDQDLVRSAIPCYFTSRLAAENVKVVLSGEGADELFGGYTYYKDVAPDQLAGELRRSVASLHNINLQRVDRLTMAHSIEGRVPFLDAELIDLAFRIPATYKIQGTPLVEKSILRKAFTDILPHEIIWRKKEQFDEGSGIASLMEKSVESVFSQSDAEKHARKHEHVYLRSTEECYYHKIFSSVFQQHEKLLKNVGRWSQRPVDIY